MVNPTFQAVFRSTHIHPSSKFTLKDFQKESEILLVGCVLQKQGETKKEKRQDGAPSTSKWSYNAYKGF